MRNTNKHNLNNVTFLGYAFLSSKGDQTKEITYKMVDRNKETLAHLEVSPTRFIAIFKNIYFASTTPKERGLFTQEKVLKKGDDLSQFFFLKQYGEAHPNSAEAKAFCGAYYELYKERLRVNNSGVLSSENIAVLEKLSVHLGIIDSFLGVREAEMSVKSPDELSKKNNNLFGAVLKSDEKNSDQNNPFTLVTKNGLRILVKPNDFIKQYNKESPYTFTIFNRDPYEKYSDDAKTLLHLTDIAQGNWVKLPNDVLSPTAKSEEIFDKNKLHNQSCFARAKALAKIAKAQLANDLNRTNSADERLSLVAAYYDLVKSLNTQLNQLMDYPKENEIIFELNGLNLNHIDFSASYDNASESVKLFIQYCKNNIHNISFRGCDLRRAQFPDIPKNTDFSQVEPFKPGLKITKKTAMLIDNLSGADLRGAELEFTVRYVRKDNAGELHSLDVKTSHANLVFAFNQNAPHRARKTHSSDSRNYFDEVKREMKQSLIQKALDKLGNMFFRKPLSKTKKALAFSRYNILKNSFGNNKLGRSDVELLLAEADRLGIPRDLSKLNLSECDLSDIDLRNTKFYGATFDKIKREASATVNDAVAGEHRIQLNEMYRDIIETFETKEEMYLPTFAAIYNALAEGKTVSFVTADSVTTGARKEVLCDNLVLLVETLKTTLKKMFGFEHLSLKTAVDNLETFCVWLKKNGGLVKDDEGKMAFSRWLDKKGNRKADFKDYTVEKAINEAWSGKRRSFFFQRQGELGSIAKPYIDAFKRGLGAQSVAHTENKPTI